MTLIKPDDVRVFSCLNNRDIIAEVIEIAGDWLILGKPMLMVIVNSPKGPVVHLQAISGALYRQDVGFPLNMCAVLSCPEASEAFAKRYRAERAGLVAANQLPAPVNGNGPIIAGMQ